MKWVQDTYDTDTRGNYSLLVNVLYSPAAAYRPIPLLLIALPHGSTTYLRPASSPYSLKYCYTILHIFTLLTVNALQYLTSTDDGEFLQTFCLLHKYQEDKKRKKCRVVVLLVYSGCLRYIYLRGTRRKHTSLCLSTKKPHKSNVR